MREAFDTDWQKTASLVYQLKNDSRVKQLKFPNLSWTDILQFLSLIEYDMRVLNWRTRFQNAEKKHHKKMKEEEPVPPFAPDHINELRNKHRELQNAEENGEMMRMNQEQADEIMLELGIFPPKKTRSEDSKSDPEVAEENLLTADEIFNNILE